MTALRCAAAAVAGALLLAALPVTADPAPPTTALVEPLPQLRNLDELDTLLAARDRMIWSVRNEENDPNSVIFGRPLLQYADQYVFTREADALVQSLRAKAASQAAVNARTGLAETLQQARAALDLERYRMAVLYAHRDLSSRLTAHEAALKTFMDKSPAAEQQQARARLEPLVGAAQQRLDALLRIPAVDELRAAYAREPIGALPRAYNEERMRLAPFAAAWDREHGVAPMVRERSKPCGRPYPAPSATDKPALDRSSVTEPDYPPEAERLGFEGNVQVKASISARGCAERMEIARSAGLASLDAAALAWAEGLRFHPAQVGGTPQAANHTIAVTFRLD